MATKLLTSSATSEAMAKYLDDLADCSEGEPNNDAWNLQTIALRLRQTTQPAPAVVAWCIVPESYERTGSMCLNSVRMTEQAAWEAEMDSKLFDGLTTNPNADRVRFLYCELGHYAVRVVIVPKR